MKPLQLLLACLIFSINTTAQDLWTKKADFAGPLRVFKATGFGIGDKGYIGTANQGTLAFSDLWEYDLASNSWAQQASFSSHSSSAISFSIGNKGYIGTGFYSNSYKSDFWEFDPSTNTWTQVADFGGGNRASAIGFSINNKGYAGTGFDGSVIKKDFWEYDPVTNSWIQRSDFGGGLRQLAVGFNIGNKGYVGTGTSTTAEEKDFWEYNPSTDSWTKKADFMGGTRQSAVGFGINNNGYVGLGAGGYTSWNDFWEYNPLTNNWIKKSDFPGGTRLWATGFSVGSKGFIGTGVIGGQIQSDFWEYNPNIVNICDQTWMLNNLTVSNYRNGDPIPQVSDPVQWSQLTTGAWCYYNNDPSTEAIYGKMYNWYAVNDPRGLAPEGWRIPNNGDWIALENCAGGYFSAGGALKEAGNSHWTGANTGATNSTGFTALPGGLRTGGGSFSMNGTVGNWWSSNAGQYYHFGILIQGGYYRSLFTGSTIFFGNENFSGFPSLPITDYKSGLSVRCVRDCLPNFSECPSDITVNTEGNACALPINYTATYTGPPETNIQYVFTGATVGSGTGTGSGQSFNPGITQVSIGVSTSCGTDSCKFTVTVVDNSPPVVTCPSNQILCFNNTNNYTIPLLTATDNCEINEITYTISGTTNRSGIGSNASGAFNPGLSVINWRVTDKANNVTICQTTVRTDYPLSVTIPNTYPLLLWGDANTIYKGFGSKCAILLAVPNGGTTLPIIRYRYQWSNGSTSPVISVCPEAVGQHTYTVTITDSLGCQTTASKTITVKDVRCGQKLNKVIICRPTWLGNQEACVSQGQAVLALLLGAKLGHCNNLLPTTGTTKANERTNSFDNANQNITVSPNPNSGSFIVQISNLTASELRVMDQNGRIVYRIRINENVKTQTLNVNLANLANGMYLVQAISNQGNQSCKMIIQR